MAVNLQFGMLAGSIPSWDLSSEVQSRRSMMNRIVYEQRIIYTPANEMEPKSIF
jgi:hypothetical protein